MAVLFLTILLLAISVTCFTIACVVALAAYKMGRLESYRLAIIGSVLVMLPVHPAFVLGLPIGIWSLLVLLRPEVKAAFQQQRPAYVASPRSTAHERLRWPLFAFLLAALIVALLIGAAVSTFP